MTREQFLSVTATIVFHGLLLLGLSAWRINVPGGASRQSLSHDGVLPESEKQPAKPTTVETSKGSPVADQPASKPSAEREESAPDRETGLSQETLEGNGFVVTSSYSWSDGSKRKKLAGILPKPPDNATSSGSVTLDVVVAPNGTAKSLKAVQPSRTGFEKEAVRQVRRWRFEVIPRSRPQRDQHCTVTFLLRKG
jgi:TonB family protein